MNDKKLREPESLEHQQNKQDENTGAERGAYDLSQYIAIELRKKLFMHYEREKSSRHSY